MKMKRFVAMLTALVLALGVFAFSGCGLKKYTVTFDYGAGTGSVATVKVKANAFIKELPTPDTLPAGKYFDGWVTEEGGIFTSDTAFDFEKDITLFASYVPIVYNINYNVDGGEPISGQVLKTYTISDSPVDLPSATKAGYEFLGWKESDSATPFKKIPAGKTGDLNLVAAWSKSGYVITFDYNGGAGNVETLNVGYGDTVELPSPETLPLNKVFAGWHKDSAEGDLFENGTAYNFERDMTLVAVYDDVPLTNYSIDYNLDGGDALPEDAIKSYTESDSPIDLPSATKAGYDFVGWKMNGSEEAINAIPANTAEDLSLVATWKVKQFTITFDYNGGAGSEETRTVNYGDNISELPVPTAVPAGKSLRGFSWHLDTEDGATVTEGTAYKFEDNVTLVAVYGDEGFIVTLKNATRADFTAWADGSEEDGTTTSKVIFVEVGGKITLPKIKYDNMDDNARFNNDYYFYGWYYRDKDGKARKFDPSTAITKESLNLDSLEFTIYAKVHKQWIGPY